MEGLDFSSEENPYLSFEDERELSHAQDIKDFFDGYVGNATVLTGGEYVALFKRGSEAGFTDKELKEYLADRHIRIEGEQAPTEIHNTEYHNRALD